MNQPPKEYQDQSAGREPGHGEIVQRSAGRPRRLPDPTMPAVLATLAGLGSMLLVTFIFIRVYSSWDVPEPTGQSQMTVPSMKPVTGTPARPATQPASQLPMTVPSENVRWHARSDWLLPEHFHVGVPSAIRLR